MASFTINERYKDDPILITLSNAKSLSDFSIRTYIQHSIRILKLLNLRNVEEFFQDAENHWKTLCSLQNEKVDSKTGEITKKPYTRAPFVTTLLAAAKHHEPLQQNYQKAVEFLQGEKSKLQKKKTDEEDRNERPDNLFHIRHKDLLHIRKSLPKGSMPRILIAMYTLIPPVRNDLWNIQLLEPHEVNDNIPNYIVMKGKSWRLKVKEHKTASHGIEINTPMPPGLIDELKWSLSECPRKYLFLQDQKRNTGKPFPTAQAFSLWASQRLTEMLSGATFTLLSFRHIYVSRPVVRRHTIAHRKQIAQQMGHSVERSRKYEYVDNSKKKELPPPLPDPPTEIVAKFRADFDNLKIKVRQQ